VQLDDLPHDVALLSVTAFSLRGRLFDLLLYERDKTGWRNENALADTRRWLSSVLRLAAG